MLVPEYRMELRINDTNDADGMQSSLNKLFDGSTHRKLVTPIFSVRFF